MVNMNIEELQAQMKIDWFALDFDYFVKFYEAAKSARARFNEIEIAYNRCETRTCGHPPFKKNGSPDGRTKCQHKDAVDYTNYCHTRNELEYEWSGLWEFFDAINLPVEEPEVKDDGC